MNEETVLTPETPHSDLDLSPLYEAISELSESSIRNQENIETSLDGINNQLLDFWDVFTGGGDLDSDEDSVTNEEILDAITLLLPDPDAEPLADVSNQEILDAISAYSADMQSLYTSIYSGTISSTYVDLFDRFSVKMGFHDDYILYRSGTYEYVLCYGDLELNGTVFTGDALHSVRLGVNNSGNAGYTWAYSQGDTLNLNVGSHLVYSNLGHYPSLHRDNNLPLFVLIFLISAFFICCFIRGWFNFTLRNGSVRDSGGVKHDTETV